MSDEANAVIGCGILTVGTLFLFTIAVTIVAVAIKWIIS